MTTVNTSYLHVYISICPVYWPTTMLNNVHLFELRQFWAVHYDTPLYNDFFMM